MPRILITNDDGIHAEGLRRLEERLRELAEITVVAPHRERSAVSHGLTIDVPLEHIEISDGHYTLNGTPADCIIYALKWIVGIPPDLVISGINHGANLGDDIMYSGTVAGAREAARHGIPAIAISQAYDERPIRFDGGLKYIPHLVEAVLKQRFSGAICLNVNIPVRKIRGVKVTRQGCSFHFPHLNVLDRQGLDDLTDHAAAHQVRSDIPFDFAVLLDHFISVTPLQRDQTDYVLASSLLSDLPDSLSSPRFRIPLFR